jgi:dephospho-CoA kinase
MTASAPRNIAIVGKMYAGKTTLANQLVEDHGYSRVAMAGPLKLLAQLAYGEFVEKDKEYATTDRDTGDVVVKTGRSILQGIGQSLKYVDRDIWLKIFVNDTTNMDRAPYVVDDVRFRFEADYLRDQGWMIVGVLTNDDERIRRAVELAGKAPTDAELNHESEREAESIEVDAFVSGNADMKDLPTIAKALAEAE